MRPRSRFTGAVCAAIPLFIGHSACDGASTDAAPVSLAVRALPVQPRTVTDLGYTVTLTAARQVLVDLEFTRGGEAHAGQSSPLWGLLIGRALAHPGHASGGAVRGELTGRHVVDWMAGGELGIARVLPGALDAVDFGLGTAEAADGLAPDDPLIGANLALQATVERDGRAWTLSAAVPQDADRRIYGAPCPITAEAGGAPLPVALRPTDPFEGDSAFDGLDFAALDADGDGQIDVDDALVNRLKRALQTHDHYGIAPEAP